MKKIFLLFATLLICAFSFAGVPPAGHHNAHPAVFKKETYVYICNSNGAYAYHASKDCRGLRNCKHEVLKVTLADAVKIYKRKPCKICE